MGMIIDRCPAKEIDELPRDAPLISSMASPSSQSLSPSPSLDRFQATLGKGGKSVAATDRVMIPKLGQRDNLKKLATETFGTYNTLNTLSVGSRHTSMSAPQFATLVEIAHNLAPTYDLRKHQCYWFALIIFLVVRNRIEGKESNGDKIKQLGRWWYFAPEHTACDDENVAKDEYEKAQIQLTSESSLHILVRTIYSSHLIQVFEDKMRDPEKAQRLMKERIVKLDSEIEIAKKRAEEERLIAVEAKKTKRSR